VIAPERRLDFVLPAELEAREPPEARGLPRDAVRLLVTHGDGRVDHARFADLPDFLRPGDLLVANDSATLPAALLARRADGSALTLHLSTHLQGRLWVVEPRPRPASGGGAGDVVSASGDGEASVGARGRAGQGPKGGAATIAPAEVLALPGGATATLLTRQAGSQRLWLARLDLPTPALEYLHRWGHPIAYPYVRGQWPLAMYQTVYAREPGSAEMPSAGRAFSPAVLARLAEGGVGFATLTLHAGVASLEDHEPPYEEPYAVPAATAEAVAAARADGGRVVAVGTTVVRALESAVDRAGRIVPRRGWTDLIVTPARGVRAVDGLLTGFHEPRATHLAMLEAIAGSAHLERAYAAALAGRYLWHEFGDLHLLLP
jgi:S-adenosylmethionine:tRNA ribosyltransferase-isomerase